MHLDGDVGVFAREGLPSVFVARHRDALLVATSRTLVVEALRLGELADTVGRSSDFTEALDAGRDPGARVLFHVRPAELLHGVLAAAGEDGHASTGGVVGDAAVESAAAAAEDALSVWRSVFPPEVLGPLRGWVDLSDGRVVRARVEGSWGGGVPERIAELPAEVPDGPEALQRLAEQFAPADETIVSTGLAIGAHHAVRTFLDAQPPERRRLIDDVLADEGTDVGSIARTVGAHLAPGVGTLVARVREADELELDDPEDGGALHPIPATLAVFRVAAGSSGAALLADLDREARVLLGAPIDMDAVRLPDGALLYRLERHPFGGAWRLLTPSFALVDDLFVFCTNESFLRRALAHRSAGRAEVRPDGRGREATVVTAVRGKPLRRWVDDQRWEWAHRRSYHDWRAERQAIRAELEAAGEPRSPQERSEREDAIVAQRIRERNDTEFPAAIADYRRRWSALGLFEGGTARARLVGRTFRIDLRAVVDDEH